MKFHQVAFLLALPVSSLPFQAADQPALNDKLRPLQWVIGSWEGTSKSENLGELKWKYEIQPDLGGNVVHLRYEAFDKNQQGIMWGIGIYSRHTQANGLVTTGSGSLGPYVDQQSADKWIWQGYGYDNKGKYTTSLTEVTKIDENTMAVTFYQLTLGEQPVPEVKTTMKRVTTSPEQEIIRLENQTNDAMVSGDTQALDKILVEEWIETEDDGAVTTKGALLADLKSGKLDGTYAKMDEPKVTVYGTAAVITFRNSIKGSYDGKPYAGDYRLTDTWINRDGRWLCVAGHASKIAPGASASANVGQEIVQLENAGNDALVKGDTQALDNLMANEWSEVDEEGAVNTKRELMDAVRSGNLVFNAARMDQPNARLFDDTAVITFRNTTKGSFKGKDFSGPFRVTDTWIRRNGTWKCVATHGTKIVNQ